MNSQSRFGRFWNRYGMYIMAVFVVLALIGSLVESWYFQHQQDAQQTSLSDASTQQPDQDYACYQNTYAYPYSQKLSLGAGTFLVLPGGQSCFDINNVKDGSILPFDYSTNTLLLSDRPITGVFSTNNSSITPLLFSTVGDYCRWERNKPQFSRMDETWVYPNDVTDYNFYVNNSFDSSYKYDNEGLSSRATALQNKCEKMFPTPKQPQKVFCGGIVEYVGVDIPRAASDWSNYYQLDDVNDQYALLLTHMSGAAFLCITGNDGTLLFMKYYFPAPSTLVLRGFKNYQVRIWTWQGTPQGYVVPWQWFNSCTYMREQGFGSFETVLPNPDGDGVYGHDYFC